MEELDQYLSGRMSADERRRFEEKLAADPALEAELQVREGLQQLRLQKKVEEAAIVRKDWERRRNWRRVLAGCVLAGLMGLAVFVLFKKEAAPPTPPSSQWPKQEAPAVEPSQPAEKEELAPVAPAEKKKTPERQPIAEGTPSSELPPTQPLPTLRGDGADDLALKALLGHIWYARYPPDAMRVEAPFEEVDGLLKERDYEKAYSKLQRLERKWPESDTLFFMKAYCLMYMGEGAEALRYFGQIKVQQGPWQPLLEWYQGQCLLLAGRRAEALAVFKEIAADIKHPYQSQAKTAVRFLE